MVRRTFSENWPIEIDGQHQAQRLLRISHFLAVRGVDVGETLCPA
jgi:hypothetical protein